MRGQKSVANGSSAIETGLMQSCVAGGFNVPPAHAEEMYFPEVFGRSAGGSLTGGNDSNCSRARA